MKNYGLDSSCSISSSLSIILIMALSVWVAWVVIKEANETIANANNSPALNVQKRADIK